MEEIEKAIELINPINYKPHEIGYYVVKNGNDEGGSDYCENCIPKVVKESREYHKTERKRIIEKFATISANGFYYNKKKKVKVAESEIAKAKRYQLKEYPAKATFTYEGHDPDFGGGLREPCSCAECGEPFSCSFTPDLEEAERLLEGVNVGDISDREKWELDIAFYNFQYCKDDVQKILYEAALKIIQSFEGGGKKIKTNCV